MHQRRLIREAVAAHLTNAVEALGDRVFKSREAPGNVVTILEDGPMANVYGRKDTIKPGDYPASGFDSGVKRCLELAIEITAVGAWTVDEKLDDIAHEVELLLEGFEVPGLPSAELRLVSTEVDSTDEFEQPLGGALLLYEVEYWRPFRTDTSPEDKICHAYSLGPDNMPWLAASCADGCDDVPA